MTKRVYLYAFNNVLEIVDTKFLEDDAISVLNVRRLANWMRDTYPEPVAISTSWIIAEGCIRNTWNR